MKTMGTIAAINFHASLVEAKKDIYAYGGKTP